MVKFLIQSDGKKIIGLGLSATNMSLLKNNKPIFINGNDMHLNIDIFIFYGENEIKMREMLEPYFNEDTEIIE